MFDIIITAYNSYKSHNIIWNVFGWTVFQQNM